MDKSAGAHAKLGAPGGKGRRIALSLNIMQSDLMKTVSVRDFTSQFASLSQQPLRVQKRRKLLGTWTPAPKAPPPLDVMKRLKQSCERPLPFTGAEVVKEGRKR